MGSKSIVRTRVAVVSSATAVLVAASLALAGGGQVLPGTAKAKGYSLADAARATAVYDTGGPVAPNVPFYFLNDDATVKPGTMLYVPVFHADDSEPVDPAPFPTDLSDGAAVADYLLEAVNAFVHAHGLPADLEITDLFIQVDDKVTVLGDENIVGVTTPPLADAGPGGKPGTHFIVAAAMVTPLTPGNHTIGIGGVINGEPVVFVSYNVTVR